MKKAFIGYAKWDFVKHGVKFGTWNMHQLNNGEVQKIVDSFADLGCNRFDKQHVIPLMVKKKYITDATYDADFPDNGDLRLLELKPDVPVLYQVAAASGQHRVAALKRWIQQQTVKLKTLEKEAKRVKNMDNESIEDDDVSHYNKTLKPQLVASTRERSERVRRWAEWCEGDANR